MIYKRYIDARAFYNVTYSILLKHEAQNTLPLGNVVLGNKGGEATGWRNVNNWYMATISDDVGEILLVAIMTPPHNITMYENNNKPNDEALNLLVDKLIEENISVPGITSENNLAQRFASLYTKKMDMNYEVFKNMRIYELREVNKKIPLVGKIRNAKPEDIFYIPYWYNAFISDCKMHGQSIADDFVAIERAISRGMLFILEDNGIPVSMASATREVITGRSVGMVYTPPFYRGRGYASFCVAQVSQLVLDMGYKYVSLFTDLANPISNSIYQKIGYKPICDYQEIHFK